MSSGSEVSDDATFEAGSESDDDSSFEYDYTVASDDDDDCDLDLSNCNYSSDILAILGRSEAEITSKKAETAATDWKPPTHTGLDNSQAIAPFLQSLGATTPPNIIPVTPSLIAVLVPPKVAPMQRSSAQAAAAAAAAARSGNDGGGDDSGSECSDWNDHIGAGDAAPSYLCQGSAAPGGNAQSAGERMLDADDPRNIRITSKAKPRLSSPTAAAATAAAAAHKQQQPQAPQQQQHQQLSSSGTRQPQQPRQPLPSSAASPASPRMSRVLYRSVRPQPPPRAPAAPAQSDTEASSDESDAEDDECYFSEGSDDVMEVDGDEDEVIAQIVGSNAGMSANLLAVLCGNGSGAEPSRKLSEALAKKTQEAEEMTKASTWKAPEQSGLSNSGAPGAAAAALRSSSPQRQRSAAAALCSSSTSSSSAPQKQQQQQQQQQQQGSAEAACSMQAHPLWAPSCFDAA
ncbi:hypothetical protein JKP88DRAFT_330833 [Tribonema minus]|uniref:Uncharacterized protein n=1 Tax=Tribonema minus TaxID=303371 RepID=A0A836C9D7_9STRA|nr:hypothetical protein JKP88DRAFT_330833 [Tribonema minus]